jgi:hypothetical protein
MGQTHNASEEACKECNQQQPDKAERNRNKRFRAEGEIVAHTGLTFQGMVVVACPAKLIWMTPPQEHINFD